MAPPRIENVITVGQLMQVGALITFISPLVVWGVTMQSRQDVVDIRIKVLEDKVEIGRTERLANQTVVAEKLANIQQTLARLEAKTEGLTK